ncbi:MAG: hypothetical protein KGN76_04915 [Acidobacteriota bacterium]|nr:hypothetical protein [Acidobacteriota bacterium]
MKRLRVTLLLSIACAVMALSSGLACWQMTGSLDGPIRQAGRERLGVAYLQRLLPIEEALPADRRLAASLEGYPTTPPLARVEAGLDRSLAALDTFDRQVGMRLQTTEDMVGLRDAWRARAGQVDAGKVRRQIEVRLATLEQLVGDTSNLTLDPELDSYYLADATVTNLPAASGLVNSLLDQIQQINGRAPDAAAQRKLLTTLALLQDALQRVGTDYRVAVEADAALGPVVNEPVRLLRQRAGDALETLGGQVSEPVTGPLADSLAPALQSVLDAAFALDRSSLVALDGLLEARASAVARSRNRTLALALALLAAGLLMSAGILWGLDRRLRRVARALDEVAVGGADALADQAGRDEVGQVVAAAVGLLKRVGPAAGSTPRPAREGEPHPASPEALADQNRQLKVLVAELALAKRFGTNPDTEA